MADRSRSEQPGCLNHSALLKHSSMDILGPRDNGEGSPGSAWTARLRPLCRMIARGCSRRDIPTVRPVMLFRGSGQRPQLPENRGGPICLSGGLVENFGNPVNALRRLPRQQAARCFDIGGDRAQAFAELMDSCRQCLGAIRPLRMLRGSRGASARMLHECLPSSPLTVFPSRYLSRSAASKFACDQIREFSGRNFTQMHATHDQGKRLRGTRREAPARPGAIAI